MKASIDHISIRSVIRVGCMFYMLPYICLALLLLADGLLSGPSFYAQLGLRFGIKDIASIGALAVGIISWGFVGAVFWVIGWVITAIMYNITAWLVGGLRITLTRHDKARSRPAKPEIPVRQPHPVAYHGEQVELDSDYVKGLKR